MGFTFLNSGDDLISVRASSGENTTKINSASHLSYSRFYGDNLVIREQRKFSLGLEESGTVD
jgi:hypothetical protein